jgi:hypothetical protein
MIPAMGICFVGIVGAFSDSSFSDYALCCATLKTTCLIRGARDPLMSNGMDMIAITGDLSKVIGDVVNRVTE